jgi:nucleoside-diphosphate-sugar epimerase
VEDAADAAARPLVRTTPARRNNNNTIPQPLQDLTTVILDKHGKPMEREAADCEEQRIRQEFERMLSMMSAGQRHCNIMRQQCSSNNS